MLPPNPHPLSFPDGNRPLVSPGTIYPLFCFAYLVYPVGFPRFHTGNKSRLHGDGEVYHWLAKDFSNPYAAW